MKPSKLRVTSTSISATISTPLSTLSSANLPSGQCGDDDDGYYDDEGADDGDDKSHLVFGGDETDGALWARIEKNTE